jgi:hypothetical protein
LKTAVSNIRPKITALLWALLQQVDGNPALQSLVMCLYFIASGMGRRARRWGRNCRPIDRWRVPMKTDIVMSAL